ncbi:hypothetical protein EP331_11955 [bacterium]|nr:MAG: hypothetical protein EP331_11955 [bacterium]
MKRFRIFIALVLLSACTASRWKVENEKAIDPKSGKIQEINTAIKLENIRRGRNAALQFQISEVRKTLYDQKIQSRRFVQQYSPRWTWFFLGFGASGLMYYMANGVDHGSADANSQAQITYNVLGSATFLATLYNQKPVGEPRSTDEIKYLAKTGEIVRNDTVKITAASAETVRMNIYFRDQVWTRNYTFTVSSDVFEIPVFDLIANNYFLADKAEEVVVDMEYKNEFFEFFIPIERFMQPYAMATKTAYLMSKPTNQRKDQITNIRRGAMYPLQSSELGEWNTVSFGAATAYISKQSSEMVWARPGNEPDLFAQKSADAGFSSDMIEVNIPLEVRRPQNPAALLVYNRPNSDEPTQDDIRALKAYLIQTFGYEDEQVTSKNNLSYAEFLTYVQNYSDSGPHGEITLFLSASFADGDEPTLQFSNKGEEEKIPLKTFYTDLSKARGVNYRVFLDVMYSSEMTVSTRELRELTGSFLQGLDQSFVWFSALPGQLSGAMKSAEKQVGGNYSAFMYYLLSGVKQGLYSTTDLKNYLDKELNYLSRKEYERPQESLLISKSTLNLLK